MTQHNWNSPLHEAEPFCGATEPAGHAAQTEERAAAAVPIGQMPQIVCPLLGAARPAWQSEQTVAPSVLENVPGEQAEHNMYQH